MIKFAVTTYCQYISTLPLARLEVEQIMEELIVENVATDDRQMPDRHSQVRHRTFKLQASSVHAEV